MESPLDSEPSAVVYPARKSSAGKQKVLIEQINAKNKKYVAFTKRRNGLFKKARELCILCGVVAAIIVISPGGKIYSFGHPNLESLIDTHLSGNSSTESDPRSQENSNYENYGEADSEYQDEDDDKDDYDEDDDDDDDDDEGDDESDLMELEEEAGEEEAGEEEAGEEEAGEAEEEQQGEEEDKEEKTKQAVRELRGWDQPIDKMELGELKNYAADLRSLREVLVKRVDELEKRDSL